MKPETTASRQPRFASHRCPGSDIRVSPGDNSTLPTSTTSTSVELDRHNDQYPTRPATAPSAITARQLPVHARTGPTTIALTPGINDITVRLLDEANNSGADTNRVAVTTPLSRTLRTPRCNLDHGVDATVTFTVNGSATVPAGTTCTITRNGTTVTDPVFGFVDEENAIQVSSVNSTQLSFGHQRRAP